MHLSLLDVHLNDFSIILQLLLVFYLGNAFSEKFQSFFEIERAFLSALNVIDDSERAKEIRPLSEEAISPENKIAIEHLNLNKRAYSAGFEKLKSLALAQFEDKELFKALRPFYIYSGFYCLALMFCGAFMENVDRIQNLTYLNLLCSIVMPFSIYKSIRLNRQAYHWGPVKSCSYFIPINFIIAVIPIAWLNWIPQLIGDGYFLDCFHTNNTNFQIVLSIFFSFWILILHVAILLTLSIRLMLLRPLFRKAADVNNLKALEAPGNSDDIPILE